MRWRHEKRRRAHFDPFPGRLSASCTSIVLQISSESCVLLPKGKLQSPSVRRCLLKVLSAQGRPWSRSGTALNGSKADARFGYDELFSLSCDAIASGVS